MVNDSSASTAKMEEDNIKEGLGNRTPALSTTPSASAVFATVAVTIPEIINTQLRNSKTLLCILLRVNQTTN